MQSSFFKEKRHLTDGFLGPKGLKKLRQTIAIREDAGRQVAKLIYGNGPKLQKKFITQVNGVLDLMEDSCAATRCEQLLTHKSLYEMPSQYYIKS